MRLRAVEMARIADTERAIMLLPTIETHIDDQDKWWANLVRIAIIAEPFVVVVVRWLLLDWGCASARSTVSVCVCV